LDFHHQTIPILHKVYKEQLLLIDDIHAQQKFIRELMINSDGSDPNISKSFRKPLTILLVAMPNSNIPLIDTGMCLA
jgi:hypothetical protein